MLIKESGRTFKPAPIGNHIARCVKLIDLGTQENEFKGVITHPRQVVISWELPNELMEEGESKGKPFLISRIYTASLSERANLRADLEMWRGRTFTTDELKGFDLRNILGKVCLVNILHTDAGKAKVVGISAVPKNMECPPQVNSHVYFSLDPNEFRQEIYDSLSDWYRATIAKSPEYQALHSIPVDPIKSMMDMDDDIAF